jgi:hypothetical protein
VAKAGVCKTPIVGSIPTVASALDDRLRIAQTHAERIEFQWNVAVALHRSTRVVACFHDFIGGVARYPDASAADAKSLQEDSDQEPPGTAEDHRERQGRSRAQPGDHDHDESHPSHKANEDADE